MKIRLVGAELFYVDGRTDMTKLFAFRNFTYAHKNCRRSLLCRALYLVHHATVSGATRYCVRCTTVQCPVHDGISSGESRCTVSGASRYSVQCITVHCVRCITVQCPVHHSEQCPVHHGTVHGASRYCVRCITVHCVRCVTVHRVRCMTV